VSLKSFRHF
jgi:hypothetical protein